MESKYIYQEQDVTIDILLKIEQIIRIIAEKEGRDFDTVYQDFLLTKTYAALQNTESLMWAESAEFVVDEYYRETA
jgi:hypothetical protein